MTPLEAALARVRELREIEKRTHEDINLCAADFWERLADTRKTEQSLRNAAPAMLNLLEQLLDYNVNILCEPDVACDECQKTYKVLAAFVEGKG